jgi:hypothetical protein
LYDVAGGFWIICFALYIFIFYWRQKYRK